MRRRILLTLLASTSIVLVAFLVPLMVIIGSFAVDRAQREVVLQIQPLVSRIPCGGDPTPSTSSSSAFAEETGHPATVYLADDTSRRGADGHWTRRSSWPARRAPSSPSPTAGGTCSSRSTPTPARPSCGCT